MDWFNSDPVRQFRTNILGSARVKQCTRCYLEEDHGGNSRRIKSNQKSVIFNRSAFAPSFEQSPGYKHFLLSSQQQGLTSSYPIDLHIDLGNFCNLACKMCGPHASSTIAVQHVRWGIEASKKYLGNDWTKDPAVWSSFKDQILQLPNLNNIHFMGGETLLTDRLENLVDHMIAHERFDVCFSFVTNGTVLNEQLVKKLQKFRRVGLEISIETVDEHNAYQRQGTDTNLVLTNIERYLSWCDNTSVTVALRPAPSILTIGYYHTLLQYALDRKLIVKSNLCYSPRFLSAEILPADIKELYSTRYLDLIAQLDQVEVTGDFNASDPNNYAAVIKEHALMCLSILQSETPSDSEQHLHDMVRHCERWDKVYGYDARKLYPEFASILDRHDYRISS